MLLLFFVVGACFGSFVTMASYRLPREESISLPPSRCPACGTRLKVLDLIPLLSWLMQRGKCRHCGAGIHLRYPLIELVMGLVFVAIYEQHGLTGQMLIFCLFAVAIWTMIIADLETKIIPDEIHYFLIILGFTYHGMSGADWAAVMSCAGVALLFGALLHYGYYWLRGYHGLGFGDVKFLAVAGLWLGDPLLLLPFLCLSGLWGVVTALLWRFFAAEPQFPFGPALAVSLSLLLVHPPLADHYWQLMRALYG
jgi:leader peptidase (prepilin peptidase)/N-methyltransferase